MLWSNVYNNRFASHLVVFAIIRVIPIWSHAYFSMCLLLPGPCWACTCIFLTVMEILSSLVHCVSWLLSDLWLLASWAHCLSANLAKLGHLHGDLGLKLGINSWLRSDSKMSLFLFPWSPYLSQELEKRCILLTPRKKTVFQSNFYLLYEHESLWELLLLGQLLQYHQVK